MNASQNPYLSGKIPVVFFKTAVPIIVVMLVNGAYNIINAYFLGRYVGESALSAVTLVFPIQMLLFAFATLFASGMASVLARSIGANDKERASQVFSNAHILVFALFAALAVGYVAAGKAVVGTIVGEYPELVAMSSEYIAILVYSGPILGILALNTDALRSEGKLEFMSAMLFLSAGLNVLFDYVLIAKMGYGVAASAYATVLAQSISLGLIIQYRARGKSILSTNLGGLHNLSSDLKEIFPLGVPMSLGYVGIALTIAAINYNVQVWAGAAYETIVAANGIVTRLMTFAILPVIGINVAFQTIIGNNFGARQTLRTNETITFGILVSAVYCIAAQIIFMVLAATNVGATFVNDAAVIFQTSRILFLVSAGFFVFGPLMLIAGYFQAIGEAKKAIVLGLSKNYLFMLPLVFLMPYMEGELGIWLAAPISDALLVLVAIVVLNKTRDRSGFKYGLYVKEAS